MPRRPPPPSLPRNRCQRRRPPVRLRLPVLRRPRSSHCRRRMPARRRAHRAQVATPARVPHCAQRRPGCLIAHALPALDCRRAVVQARVAAISADRVLSLQQRRRSVVRPFVRRGAGRRDPVVERPEPVAAAPRRAPVAIRVAVVARRASVGRSIKLQSTPTSRRRCRRCGVLRVVAVASTTLRRVRSSKRSGRLRPSVSARPCA